VTRLLLFFDVAPEPVLLLPVILMVLIVFLLSVAIIAGVVFLLVRHKRRKFREVSASTQ
jgi:ABC-type polysaccharide/polyol phosphate export permease